MTSLTKKQTLLILSGMRIEMKKTDALNYFNNSGAKMARALDIKSEATYMWGEFVPQTSAWPLWYMTRGKIPSVINIERLE